MSLIKHIVRAAITEDAVQKFQHLYQDKHNIEIDKKQALWLLGFHTGKEIELHKHLVRSQMCRHKVFEAYVYHGFVRNTIKTETVDSHTIPMVDTKGKLCYTNNLHPMASLYESVEVVTGDAIPDDVEDILTIGTITAYNKTKDGEEGWV